ncbi:hydrolase of sodium-potassium ATPase alpha subunit [Mycobacterium kansasii]|nr:hydrolase of sodium-potassium ATPase alpha subunit [Mycobacterium kansasii]
MVEVTGTGYAPDGVLQDRDGAPVSVDAHAALRWSLIAGARCNDAALSHDDGHWSVIGDPTEGAMLVVAAKAGLDVERVAAGMPRVAAIPFSSERQYMATLHRDGADHVVLAKGAVERMLELSSTQLRADGALRPLDRATVLRAADLLSARGLRVLATAVRAGADPASSTTMRCRARWRSPGCRQCLILLGPPRHPLSRPATPPVSRSR